MKTMSETIEEANNRSKGIRNPYDYLYKPGEDRKNFPEALHDMSNDDKINYFESKIISHTRLSELEKEILDYIKHPKKKILLVLGPPQIGKSTLLENVNMSILAEYVSKMNDDPGFIPITWVEAFNSRRKIYDWKPVYSSAYEILNEALDSKLISRTKSPLGQGEAGYRDSFIKALKNRHTKIVQIDEGHLLVYVSDKRGQLEEIKTISNFSKALIIIYGTYALAEFIRPNAQLALRNHEFHFSRYKPLNEDPEDFNNFVDAIGTFQNYLPVRNTPQLVDHAEYIYLNTAGCVGVLKVWLQSCLSDSLE